MPKQRNRTSNGPKGQSSQLRIIGGSWRGRKLTFLPGEGLRPTTDRVRETLFNWLTIHLHDARCADLFAGSGALGLEALSRGAASCDFIDASKPAIQQIATHLDTLDASTRGNCHQQQAADFLKQHKGPFDLVFIDPPFGQGLAQPSCEQLLERGLLAEGAMIYIEVGVDEGPLDLPDALALYREKTAGAVCYRLYQAF
jgi:16S rRNA (guanine966-N2)-methyltransferase